MQTLLQGVPGGRALDSLRRADAAWRALCDSDPTRQPPPPQVVAEAPGPVPGCAGLAGYDVVVLGGTLGIFLAAALQLRGRSVLVVERGRVAGRDQEWNISRADMAPFLELGLITPAQLEQVIVSEFNPVRMGFQGGPQLVTRDVLNCGVLPATMVDLVKATFLRAGGRLMEGAAFQQATVHQDGVAVDLALQQHQPPAGAGGAGGEAAQLATTYASGSSGQARPLPPGGMHPPGFARQVFGRLPDRARIPQGQALMLLPGGNLCAQERVVGQVLVDAMGAWSPLAAQARRGRKPDSVVLMVGTCATGLPPPPAADLLWSFTPLSRELGAQMFWEVFPARDGVTTYMFTYVDPSPGRLSLEAMFCEYLRRLPEYRGCAADLAGVAARRAFFGFVPNWHDSPLAPAVPRLLHIGDAAGNRSALSFAGFGAIARHLPRLAAALDEAVAGGHLGRRQLGLLQPASPAISMTAAMQYSMGTRAGQDLDSADPQIINDYLGDSFASMARMGERVYRPFMQDYLQWPILSRIVGRQLVANPRMIVEMTKFMRSPQAGLMFLRNFWLLAVYDALFRVARVVDPAHRALLAPLPAALFAWRRLVEAFEVGSANDYKPQEAVPPANTEQASS